MDNTRTIELAIVIATAVGGFYLYVNKEHAKQDEQLQVEFEVRKEIADDKAKRYAETANYYIRKEEEGMVLGPAEKSRKEYNQAQMKEAQKEVKKYDDALMKLKQHGHD